ncbi:MAG: response regulator [Marinilabiliales bacterium]|nr:response regulator [Marinilabiliales bacterium]
MLVEDNDDVIHYLMTILSKDHDVIVAGNGQEGLNKAIEYVPDLIPTDIMMPVMDGIAMLGKVKQNPMTSHIPVVVLTARADVASRIDGLERGPTHISQNHSTMRNCRLSFTLLSVSVKRLQERYAAIGHLNLKEDEVFHIEDAFIHRVREIMLCKPGE